MKTQQLPQNECEILSIYLSQIYFKIIHPHAQITANTESLLFFKIIKIIFKNQLDFGIDCTLFCFLQFVFHMSNSALLISNSVSICSFAFFVYQIVKHLSVLFKKTNKLLYLLIKSYQIEAHIYYCCVVRGKNINHTHRTLCCLFCEAI